jgi:hypothetical protein
MPHGARRIRSCPNRLQAFGGFQRQAPQTWPARRNHRLRAVEGKVRGVDPANSLRTEELVIALNSTRQPGMIVLCFLRAQGKVKQPSE